MTGVPELCAVSAFSFLEGTASPEDLVQAAARLGLPALGIADRDAVYGLPRAWKEAQRLAAEGPAPRLLHGARLTVRGLPGLVLHAADARGWARLCRLITAARSGGALDAADGAAPHGRPGVEKGRARLPLEALLTDTAGLEAIVLGAVDDGALAAAREAFGGRLSLGLTRALGPDDAGAFAERMAQGARVGVPLLATMAPLMVERADRPLADVLACIRLGVSLDGAGRALAPNAERFLRGAAAMDALFAACPAALDRAREVAGRLHFTLAELAYRYPREVVPPGWTAMGWLERLTWEGLEARFPGGVPGTVRATARHELGVIARLDFPAYFLTVHDVVREARQRGILCQGRGSAANSVVCFALGVTSVDPTATSLLFERFLSEERGEPPDIDVDFEHERREELIQYVYGRYGRERAAMVCNIITWRRRSAVRDVGKALGFPLDVLDRLAGSMHWFDTGGLDTARLAEAGLDAADPRVAWLAQLVGRMVGLPRHLGVHSGGFTISDGPLVDLVPVEPATMEARTVLQWDKDDLDTVGFVKVDLLSLGILTAIRRAFHLLAPLRGVPLDLASVPAEDPETYDMLCAADSMGIFQVESRAQMSMLPRLRPRTWYDLVIQISLVRPGPIQGGMVHPYLHNRADPSAIDYTHPALEPILSRTCGIPIFQEQVMAMAVAVGGFTPGEADQLRRAMGAWRKRGGLEAHTARLMDGMAARGIPADYAARIAAQIRGFGEYGFPESHAASFAHLVYVSAWLRRQWPAAFCAALLNSQPMGFYAPRTLVADAARHGVEVRPVCVQASAWDCTLEAAPGTVRAEGRAVPAHALRLGLRMVRGLSEADAAAIERARATGGPFRSAAEVAARAGVRKDVLLRLARAGAFDALGAARRDTVWAVQGLLDLPLFRGLARAEPPVALPAPTPDDDLRLDFAATGLSLHRDPVALARPRLARQGVVPAAEALARPDGAIVSVAGVVTHRQRPGTANGVLFMTLEDESGLANLIVWPKVVERQRALVLGHPLVVVRGRVQRQGDATSLLALGFRAFPAEATVAPPSRDFR